MFGDFEIREMPLSLSSVREKVGKFLLSQDLRMESLDRYFGIFDSADRLVGGGGIEGNVIKCIALSEATRNESLTNPLVSRIRESAITDGHPEVFLFTKPKNRKIFESLAFHTIGESEKAILLESDPRGVTSYCQTLRKTRDSLPHTDKQKNGVIVMNCNPMTSGHLFLIETAATQVDRLFIIPVMEGKPEYDYIERKEMIEKGVDHLSNVSVVSGSPYSVSQATFPTYFLKDLSDASRTHIELDLDIFARHIAPALDVSVRFIGSEPTDALTREYNAMMHQMLPARGIEVIEISRLEKDGCPVSASRVRRLTQSMQAGAAIQLLPPTSIPYILSHMASICLREELDLTPKPGLVDLNDTGAHTDMDHSLMNRSITSLQPWFREICEIASRYPSHEETSLAASGIKEAGIAAENAMLKTTNGINTHRGALFSIGITLAATMRLHKRTCPIGEESLQKEIQELALFFPGGEKTNGAQAKTKFGIKGAAETAKEGYRQLYSDWLPFWRQVKSDADGKLKLLLRIMTTLDDTNIYYRGGIQGSLFVKETAERILRDFSLSALQRANVEFIGLNLSPGGAADMLALTLLTHSLIPQMDNSYRNNK